MPRKKNSAISGLRMCWTFSTTLADDKLVTHNTMKIVHCRNLPLYNNMMVIYRRCSGGGGEIFQSLSIILREFLMVLREKSWNSSVMDFYSFCYTSYDSFLCF